MGVARGDIREYRGILGYIEVYKGLYRGYIGAI